MGRREQSLMGRRPPADPEGAAAGLGAHNAVTGDISRPNYNSKGVYCGEEWQPLLHNEHVLPCGGIMIFFHIRVIWVWGFNLDHIRKHSVVLCLCYIIGPWWLCLSQTYTSLCPFLGSLSNTEQLLFAWHLHVLDIVSSLEIIWSIHKNLHTPPSHGTWTF